MGGHVMGVRAVSEPRTPCLVGHAVEDPQRCWQARIPAGGYRGSVEATQQYEVMQPCGACSPWRQHSSMRCLSEGCSARRQRVVHGEGIAVLYAVCWRQAWCSVLPCFGATWHAQGTGYTPRGTCRGTRGCVGHAGLWGMQACGACRPVGHAGLDPPRVSSYPARNEENGQTEGR